MRPMGMFFNRSVGRPPADDDLAALLEGLRREEPEALEKLYDLTINRVYALALRIVGDPDDAEEVSCDVYQQVWRNAKQYDARRGNPLQWLMVIARTRALDFYRARRWQRQQVHLDEAEFAYLEDGAPTADALLEQFESESAVRVAVAKLTPDQARLIGLAFFEGLTHQEIADRTRMPLGTVKSHVQRGLMALRKSLGATDNGDDQG